MKLKMILSILLLIAFQWPSYSQTTPDHKKNASHTSLQNSIKITPDFNDEKIEISFILDKQSYVNIKITDILGNEPFSLLNERLSTGEFKRNFNIPIKLAKGMCFIKVYTGDELVIKRISVQ